jgi:hypothetical protein
MTSRIACIQRPATRVVVACLTWLLLSSGLATAQNTQPLPRPRAVSSTPNADILKLLQAQVGEPIILDVIAKSGRSRFDTSIDAIVALKAAGATDRMIAAMRGIDAPAATPVARLATKAAAMEVAVPDGTEVKLQLLDHLSSATAMVGQKVRLEVVDEVRVKDHVVIAQGASAVGTVTVAEPRKNFGRRGRLDFTIDAVKAQDGQNIRLRITKRAQGGERYVTAGVVSYFTLVGGLFVRGKDVEVDAGTQYSIYIDGERRVALQDASR